MRRFNAVTILELTNNSHMYMERQRDKNNQNSLGKKNNVVGLTLSILKTYYKVIVIVTVCEWQKNRHTGQWNKIESRNKCTHSIISKGEMHHLNK